MARQREKKALLLGKSTEVSSMGEKGVMNCSENDRGKKRTFEGGGKAEADKISTTRNLTKGKRKKSGGAFIKFETRGKKAKETNPGNTKGGVWTGTELSLCRGSQPQYKIKDEGGTKVNASDGLNGRERRTVR